MSRPYRRIGIAVDGGDGLGQRALQSLPRLRRDHPAWEIIPCIYQGDGAAAFLRHAGVSGAIVRPGCQAAVEAQGIPVVTLGHVASSPWHVGWDEEAVGALATTLHREHGRPHLAFAAYPGDAPIWAGRRQGSRSAAGPVPWSEAVITNEDDAVAWLGTLPPGTGIVAVNDVLAYRIQVAARRLALALPEDLALIGVDDDPLFTTLLPLTGITSVRPDIETVMDTAAMLLTHRLGEGPAPASRRIPPLGLTERDSTAPVPGADLEVRALALIRRHACHGLGVGELASRLGISPRSLERRFQAAQGRSPLDAIHEVRVTCAEQVLARGGSVAEAATAAGFASPQRLRAAFQRLRRTTPGAWAKSRR